MLTARRSRGAGGRRAAHRRRDRWPPRPSWPTRRELRAARRRVCGRWRAPCRSIYGAELTTLSPALEDADEREREAARLLRRAAGGRPQRDLRLGRACPSGPPLRRPPRGRRPAPAGGPSLRAHGAAIADAGRRVVRVETAGETPLERLLWAVMLGDLCRCASPPAGCRPPPIAAIEALKSGWLVSSIACRLSRPGAVPTRPRRPSRRRRRPSRAARRRSNARRWPSG